MQYGYSFSLLTCRSKDDEVRTQQGFLFLWIVINNEVVFPSKIDFSPVILNVQRMPQARISHLYEYKFRLVWELFPKVWRTLIIFSDETGYLLYYSSVGRSNNYCEPTCSCVEGGRGGLYVFAPIHVTIIYNYIPVHV